MIKCSECGGMVDESNYICTRCGKEITYRGVVSRKGDASIFAENDVTRTVVKKEGIGEPCLWMYILSVFYPVLQWILIGVYVSKNDFDSAFGLWLKPLIAQIIISVIAIIIIAVATS